jgi:hypothetical protein
VGECVLYNSIRVITLVHAVLPVRSRSPFLHQTEATVHCCKCFTMTTRFFVFMLCCCKQYEFQLLFIFPSLLAYEVKGILVRGKHMHQDWTTVLHRASLCRYISWRWKLEARRTLEYRLLYLLQRSHIFFTYSQYTKPNAT